MKPMPMFLENSKWYTKEMDEEGHLHFELTDIAPEEARESYEIYYRQKEQSNKNDNESNSSIYVYDI